MLQSINNKSRFFEILVVCYLELFLISARPKRCVKIILEDHGTLKLVPDQNKTQEMCERNAEEDSYMPEY